jgi:hypothetical protein
VTSDRTRVRRIGEVHNGNSIGLRIAMKVGSLSISKGGWSFSGGSDLALLAVDRK